MRGLRVAAVQLRPCLSQPRRLVSEAEGQVRLAAEKKARLICLPEHWLLSRVLKPDDAIPKRFSRLAKELDAFINLGAYYEARDGKKHLASVTVSPAGKVHSRQDKVHLYRRERRIASPGSSFELMQVDGFQVGVLVCHDIVFPEAARSVALKGAELLLVPSLISSDGTRPWLCYLRARALENRVPIVAPNIYLPPRFLGESRIIDLFYDRKEHVMDLREKRGPQEVGVIVMDLDLASKRNYRKERLREMKPEAYVQK